MSLAMCAALDGRQVLLVGLDPRGATTEWLRLQPEQRGWHFGAILADDSAGEVSLISSGQAAGRCSYRRSCRRAP